MDNAQIIRDAVREKAQIITGLNRAVWEYAEPVSYTHLDVYKRQVLLPKYIVKPFLDDLCQPFSLLRRLIVKDLAAGNLLLVIAVLVDADHQIRAAFLDDPAPLPHICLLYTSRCV